MKILLTCPPPLVEEDQQKLNTSYDTDTRDVPIGLYRLTALLMAAGGLNNAEGALAKAEPLGYADKQAFAEQKKRLAGQKKVQTHN